MPQGQTAAANPLGYERIGKLVLRFSVPTVISFLVNAIYNIVDQIFLGRGVGMLAMSATNVTMPLTTICTALSLLLGIGAAANFNLKLGEGDKDAASRFAGTALTLLAVGGLTVAALVLLFMQPMLVLFGATEQSLPHAMAYTRILALGIPFQIFGNAACQLIRSDGSPRFSMFAITSGAVFNLVFDPIFLYVFNMGIEGIAWATTLGFLLTAAIAVVYLARHFKSATLTRSHLRPRAAIAGKICALGAGSCINQLAMTVVQIVLNNTLRHYGALSEYGADVPIAAVGAITKISIIFLAFTVGISQGSQPIYGFNYGAKQYARVKQAIKVALLAGTVFAFLAFFCFQLFPRPIMAIFGSGEDYGETYFTFGVAYLRTYMMLTFVNAIQPLLTGFFTAIGKAPTGAFLSLTRQVIFLVPLLVLLPRRYGIDGVMYAGPIADAAAAVLTAVLLWREIAALTKLEKQTALEQPAAPAAGT